MSAITIICVWNRKSVFAELVNQLQQQKDITYTLLDVDNSSNQFSSARQAFNSQLGHIDTDLVAFMHQDIRFLDEYALRDLLNWVDTLPEFGVVGIAGCPAGRKWRLLSSIVHGAEKIPAGEPVAKPISVQTVEECLFIMRRDVIRENTFSNLEGWHMYTVEQCMEMLRMGRQNYVVPARIWHLSKGDSLDASYITTLEVLARRYQGTTRYLNTSVKQWKTKGPDAKAYRVYYRYKQKLKRFLMKLVKKR